MRLILIFIGIVLGVGSPASGHDVSACTTIRDGIGRLACYDKVSGYVIGAPPASHALPTQTKAAVASTSHWRVNTTTSPIDDSKNVIISTSGINGITDRFGRASSIQLVFGCRENRTSAWFVFDGNYMADIQGYGDITYRVDARSASKRSFSESTDNEALGLWNGGTAIPFAKDLFGGESLYVQATPYSESTVSDTLNISGLAEVITPLRQACGW